jgi:alkyl hydroperoxide reductase subunit AhpC
MGAASTYVLLKSPGAGANLVRECASTLLAANHIPYAVEAAIKAVELYRDSGDDKATQSAQLLLAQTLKANRKFDTSLSDVPVLNKSGASQSVQIKAVRIGDTAPDFDAETTKGHIRFHEWMGNSWVVLFSDPRAFSGVSATELGYLASLKSEFDMRDTKIIGLSVDPVADYERWSRDIKDIHGHELNYPMIGDIDRKVSTLYGLLSGGVRGGQEGTRTSVRNVLVIAPDKTIKLVIAYPITTGRNFNEVLRVIDSLQLTARHKVMTPANWKQGEDVIIAGTVSNDDARRIFPRGWHAPKPYLRFVPQPEKKVEK